MPNPTNSSLLIRAHVFVSGIVQGVGYRYATIEVATQLKLNGWVRNLPDNRVEAVFEGQRDIVNQMIQWCHQGPPAAIVKDVVVEYEHPENLQGFELRRFG